MRSPAFPFCSAAARSARSTSTGTSPPNRDSFDVQALRAYSDLIAEVVGAALAAQEHSVLAGHLRYALDYRVVIERAVGYLMGAHGLDAVTAFNILRKRARDSRRRIADVASEILEQAPAGASASTPRPVGRMPEP